jgi:hypothetical protein
MKIALFRGSGFVSESIEGLTRSVYSHSACWWPEREEIYEAESNGFVLASGPRANHDAGIIVDVFAYKDSLTAGEDSIALQVAQNMVGASYDYVDVLAGFPLQLMYEPKAGSKAFFCSEAVFLICAAMGQKRVLLERTQAWRVSPEHINLSPLLLWEETVVL